MSKLILTLGGNKIREFELDREEMIIGRRASSDIQVENLAVSGEHAKIITILSDSFLEDLKSTNGTFINGVLAKKQALQNGDVITIGKHKLRYVSENSGIGEGFDQTVFVRHGKSPLPRKSPATTDTEDETDRGGDNLDVAAATDNDNVASGTHLSIADGAKAGQLLQLTKPVTTIGRPGVQIAAITHKDDQYYLIHVETSNDGQLPLLNDSEITDEHVLLADKDEIVVAGVKMVLRLN